MERVLVTGATGTIGREVVTQLLGTDTRIRALTRKPAAAALPDGIEIVRGDLTDPDSLVPCLEGVDTVFLVWSVPAGAAPSVKRIARHVRRIVLLTSPHKTPHPFFQQPNPLRGLFGELERLIETSGVEWTFLRPGMFAANALSWWAPQVRAGNVVRWPYADAPTAPVDERDVGAVAVSALLAEEHGAEYVLTGPESLTQREQVATIGDVIGRRLRYNELTPEEAARELGLPSMLLDAWAAALGQPAHLTSTVRDVIGTEPRRFRDWVTDNVAKFRWRD